MLVLNAYICVKCLSSVNIVEILEGRSNMVTDLHRTQCHILWYSVSQHCKISVAMALESIFVPVLSRELEPVGAPCSFGSRVSVALESHNFAAKAS